MLVVKLIPGSENEANIFMKNLDGPLFKHYADLVKERSAVRRVTLSKGSV